MRMYMERMIDGKRCFIYQDESAETCLIQPVDEHDLEALGSEVERIKQSSTKPFTFVAILIKDWNEELSPWAASAVIGKQSFGAEANNTLSFITNVLVTELNELTKNSHKLTHYLGGYSLAGLFSLWAAHQTDFFSGVAAVSPSVWFPDWDGYMQSHTIQTHNVYLSLGDREDKTRNRVMAMVGERIRSQYELVQNTEAVKNCVLEWNSGNHFVDSDIRMAKGFAWLLNAR